MFYFLLLRWEACTPPFFCYYQNINSHREKGKPSHISVISCSIFLIPVPNWSYCSVLLSIVETGGAQLFFCYHQNTYFCREKGKPSHISMMSHSIFLIPVSNWSYCSVLLCVLETGGARPAILFLSPKHQFS